MMLRTKEQNSQLHRLLALTGMEDRKALLVAGFSYNRTESSSELTVEECDLLIRYLEQEDKRMHDKSRRHVRHLLLMLGWEYPKIDGYIKNMGSNNPKKKSLNNLGGQELNQVVSQVKALYKSETLKNGKAKRTAGN